MKPPAGRWRGQSGADDRRKVGRYRIVEQLGTGGMGEAIGRLTHSLIARYAIKLLHPQTFSETAARARLVREARIASQLNHPNICTIFDAVETEDQPYIVMELVEGQTLSRILESGPLEPQAVRSYACQLADALSHAHERGVVHRDLKSANVLVTGDQRIKVLDFGLAKSIPALIRLALPASIWHTPSRRRAR